MVHLTRQFFLCNSENHLKYALLLVWFCTPITPNHIFLFPLMHLVFSFPNKLKESYTRASLPKQVYYDPQSYLIWIIFEVSVKLEVTSSLKTPVT